jgi:hypothetical protein
VANSEIACFIARGFIAFPRRRLRVLEAILLEAVEGVEHIVTLLPLE